MMVQRVWSIACAMTNINNAGEARSLALGLVHGSSTTLFLAQRCRHQPCHAHDIRCPQALQYARYDMFHTSLPVTKYAHSNISAYYVQTS